MDSCKWLTSAYILTFVALHNFLPQLHVFQQPQGKRLFVWRQESMTFQLWTAWPCKTDCWWEWVHKGARPPQAATICSLSYSLLTPPHGALHHQWHYFFCWIYMTAQCLFLLHAVSEHIFQSLLSKIWENRWYITAAKCIFVYTKI